MAKEGGLGTVVPGSPWDGLVEETAKLKAEREHYILLFPVRDDGGGTMLLTTLSPKARILILEDILRQHKEGMN